MINFYNLNFFSINQFKQNLPFSLTDQQKKVAGIALLAFSCIALVYLCFRCCFQADTIDLDDDDHVPAGGVLNQAKDVLKKVGILNDPKEQIAQLLAEADEEAKQLAWDKADAKFQEALKIDSQNTRVLNKYACFLFWQGEYVEAESYFSQAMALKPNSIHLKVNYSKCLLEQGIIDEAEKCIEEALKLGPRNSYALLCLAEILVEQGKPVEADKRFDEAGLIEDSFLKNSAAVFVLGNIYYALGDFNGAAVFYKHSLLGARLDWCFSRLNRLHNQGRQKIALMLCQELLLGNNSSKERKVINEFAMNLVLKGDLKDAADVYEKLVSSDPNDSFVLSRYADVLCDLGRVHEAKNLLVQASNLKPDDPFIMQGLGYALLMKGKLKKADHHFKTLLALEPDHIYALNYHAFILSEQGLLGEAVKHFKKVLAIEPENVYALTHYADVLFKQDKFQEAKDMFEKVLKLDPQNAHALSQLAKTQDSLKAKG